MTSCLSKLKVTPKFRFPFKIPDNLTASTSHRGRQKRKLPITVTFFVAKGQIIDGRVSRGGGDQEATHY